MKTIRRFFLPSALAAFLLVPFLAHAQEIDCRMVAANVRNAIEKAPDHTLTVVEDALVAAPGCVCEIVKAAIGASKADGPLVQKIVYTAVRTTQQHAPIIAECAVAAAPAHADFVRAAFAEAFEDQPRNTRKPKQQKPVQVATTPQQEPETRPQTKPRPVPVPQSKPAPVIHESPEVVVAQTTGKEVVEIGPTYAYDPKGVVVEEPQMDLDELEEPFDPSVPYQYPPGITFFGGPPIDMTGFYLVPPVASAPPFFPEEPVKKQVKSLSTAKSPPPSQSRDKSRKPKPPVISRPISPTGP